MREVTGFILGVMLAVVCTAAYAQGVSFTRLGGVPGGSELSRALDVSADGSVVLAIRHAGPSDRDD